LFLSLAVFQRHSGDIVERLTTQNSRISTPDPATLDEYLELHTLVESPNCPDFALLYLPLDSGALILKTWHIFSALHPLSADA